jgi:hypothetical protein
MGHLIEQEALRFSEVEHVLGTMLGRGAQPMLFGALADAHKHRGAAP